MSDEFNSDFDGNFVHLIRVLTDAEEKLAAIPPGDWTEDGLSTLANVRSAAEDLAVKAGAVVAVVAARSSKKPLSKAAKRRRVKGGGDSDCPFCGAESDDFEYQDIDAEEGGVFTQVVECSVCARRWKDEYRLADVHGLC